MNSMLNRWNLSDLVPSYRSSSVQTGCMSKFRNKPQASTPSRFESISPAVTSAEFLPAYFSAIVKLKPSSAIRGRSPRLSAFTKQPLYG